MKWNSLYYLYEGVALLGILLSWSAIVFTSPPNDPSQWQSFNQNLEMALTRATWDQAESLEIMQLDVSKSGKSREGISRVQRMQKLSERTHAVLQKLEAAKDYVRTLPPDKPIKANDWLLKINQVKVDLDRQIQHLNHSFEDLHVPQFDYIADGTKRNPLYKGLPERDFAHNYFEEVLPAEAMVLLTQKQLVLRRFTSEVIKKTGACSPERYYWRSVKAQAQASVQKVQEGDEYTADLFLGVKMSPTDLQAQLNGRSIIPGQTGVIFKTKGQGHQHQDLTLTFDYKGKRPTFTHRLNYTLK
ncbi:hypothetical protein BKI52_28990 [marine bacterium AO1-C]|nr:hypothetical protein BKI52_28990 [marine bacterium AO1-C]